MSCSLHVQCTDIRKKLMLHVKVLKKNNKKNKQTILQKSNLYKAPPKQEFKEYYGIFSFGQYVEKSPHCYIPMGFSALQMVSRQRPLLTNYTFTNKLFEMLINLQVPNAMRCRW